MFMEIAITAIGIAVVLMVGYLVVAQVRAALPTTGLSANVQGNVTAGLDSTQTTVFAGFGLIAVGIIVLAAFGLVSIFRQ
jgi:hypothetical protein